jgi:hypothetical protein
MNDSQNKVLAFFGAFLFFFFVGIFIYSEWKADPPSSLVTVGQAFALAISDPELRNPEDADNVEDDQPTKVVSLRTDESIAVPVPYAPTNRIVQVRADNKYWFGLPVARFSDQYWLLRNDGAVQTITRTGIESEVEIATEFRPIAVDRLMEELRREFGPGYTVHSQPPYVFVCKAKRLGQWSSRFQALHQSLKLYCQMAGLKTKSIEFPMIAIVFGSQSEFTRYATKLGGDFSPNCVGFYSQMDNRIALFEDDKLMPQQETLDTISHEATHQLAFNMGIHQRCTSSGLWLIEGFATMFESPAYSHVAREGRSSWPASRKGTWEELSRDPSRTAQYLDSLVRNDNLFQHDADTAYTLSWALTNYLMEKETRKFSDYMFQLSRLPFAEQMTSNDRWLHFRSIFGKDASQMTRPLILHLGALR